MENQQENKEASPEYVQTQAAKTNSNAIEIPSISLPKGGGAIKSIDEKFSVNAVNGTSSFAIPLPFSSVRGFSPGISLNYNSGSGNGIFGMGWSIGLSSIKRKTEKELPQYVDAIDSDTYVLSEAEDLVPEFKIDAAGNFLVDADGNYLLHEFNSFDGFFLVRKYKPRTEGLFARIERWTEKSTGLIHWRTISKNNAGSIYGRNITSRIADPADPLKIYEWLLDFSCDDRGNCAVYEYKQEDAVGIDPFRLHNKNRSSATFTNTYLKTVRYGNVTPLKKIDDPLPGQFVFETVFDYGEHDSVNLPFNEINNWDFRNDAFSEYRAGFEIRTCRLCKRVLLYHHFVELPGRSAIVKALNFIYGNNGEEGFTFLGEAFITGYTRHDDASYTQKSLPPFTFQYQHHEWNTDVKSVSPEDLVNAPAGIDEPQYQFVDLYNEGLAVF
ncbi:MAG: SpvB/TcaC N-terminal domain-containing protein [Segetibacter sp.]